MAGARGMVVALGAPQGASREQNSAYGPAAALLSTMSVYLVTGGAGFIGSHLTEALVRRGERVRVADNVATGRWSNLDPPRAGRARPPPPTPGRLPASSTWPPASAFR